MAIKWLFGRGSKTERTASPKVGQTHSGAKSQKREIFSKADLIGPTLLALEPRVVFDGAMAATAVDAADQVAAQQAEQAFADAEPLQQDDIDALLNALSEDTKAREIVFIDGAVEDADALIAEIDDDVEVIVLDTNRDGVEQIAEVMAERENVDALHIISHGRSGTLDLGSTKLTEASMRGKHADDMAVIAAAMSDGADLLIYGCNFGANARGASAVEALATLTGADVAASDDLSGAEALGGDWDLEVQAGEIEAQAIEAASFSGVLADAAADLDIPATTTGGATTTVTGTMPDGTTFTISRVDPNDNTTPINIRQNTNIFNAAVNTTGSGTDFGAGGTDPALTGTTEFLSFDARDQAANTLATTPIVFKIDFDTPQTGAVLNFSGTANRSVVTDVASTLVNSTVYQDFNGDAAVTSVTNGFEISGDHTQDLANVALGLDGTVSSVLVTITEVQDVTLLPGNSFAGSVDSAGLVISGLNSQPVPNTPPIIDLNTDASVADTDRDNTVSVPAAGGFVNVTEAVAGVFDNEGDDYQALTITFAGISDGGAEQINVAGQAFAMDGTNSVLENIVIPGTTTQVDIQLIGNTFTIREASDQPISEADMEALIRSVQYQNSSAVGTVGARTLDFQVQQADGSFVINFENFDPLNDPTSTELESDPYWGSESGLGNGNITSVAQEPSFSFAQNADGQYLQHFTDGAVPAGEQVVFGRSNIPVTSGVEYTVSVDLGAALGNTVGGPFQIIVDGTVLQTINMSQLPVNDWATFSTTFTPTSNSVDFEIRNISTATAGNDFGIDNIIFEPTAPLISNVARATVNVTPALDTDGDGVADVNDIDDDNDGILDTVEGFAFETVSIEDFDSPVSVQPSGFDNFADAFPNGASQLENYRGTAGYFTGTAPSVTVAGQTVTFLDPHSGSGYSGLHGSNDTVFSEAVVIGLDASETLVEGASYELDFYAYQMNLNPIALAPGDFNNPGFFDIYGVEAGVDIGASNTSFTSPAQLAATPGVTLLVSSPFALGQ